MSNRPDFSGAHARRVALYNALLSDSGTDTSDKEFKFWDAVVLTAGDESQRGIYQATLDSLLASGLIPKARTKYHVLVDPPGPKIGSGGSTLLVLEALAHAYGAHLKCMNILLLHAGGYSKRLPHVSAGGKIFACLPIENARGRAMTTFELKLILYSEFPRKMDRGIFLASADTLESFTLHGSSRSSSALSGTHPRSFAAEFDFTRLGITALAHPSPPEIGTTHGVFVLEPGDQSVNVCRTFLHKPSIPLMQSHGAMSEEDKVWTDSAFFIHHSVYPRLLELREELGTIDVELEAYGDFLSPLGSEPDTASLESKANLIDASSSDAVSAARKKIWTKLAGTPLSVLALEESVFYHLGTTAEYLEHLLGRGVAVDMGFARRAGTNLGDGDGVLMDVKVVGGTRVDAEGSVVESCLVEADVKELRVGRGSILSGLHIALSDKGTVEVPSGSYVFCVAMDSGYVTFAFGVSDDLKRIFEGDVELFGGQLTGSDVLQLAGFPLSQSRRQSLWNAPIWPVFSTRKEGFEFALGVARRGQGEGIDKVQDRAMVGVSLAEALEGKSGEQMRGWVDELRGK